MTGQRAGRWAVAMVLGLIVGADLAGCHRSLHQDTAVQSDLVAETTTRKDTASQVMPAVNPLSLL